MTIVSRPEGALEVLTIKDTSPLIEIAAQYPYVLDIFRFTWINASTDKLHLQTVRTNIDNVLPTLILVFKSTDAVTLIGFVGDLLTGLDSQVCLKSTEPTDIELTIRSACLKIRNGWGPSFCSSAS